MRFNLLRADRAKRYPWRESDARQGRLGSVWSLPRRIGLSQDIFHRPDPRDSSVSYVYGTVENRRRAYGQYPACRENKIAGVC